ncbi:MAG: hypothetical protein QOG51_1955 [Verrucomicrobiota bacterium]|jgi:hypothetical protein
MKRAVFIAIAVHAAAAALAQDHLTPEPGPLADENEYHVKVREVFTEVWRKSVLQVVFFPSFEPEEMAGIRKTENGFEAFASKPSSHIWETYLIYEAEKQTQGKPLNPDSPLAEMKKQSPSDFRQITIHTDSRAISAPLTERIRRVWQDMLLNARHPKQPALGVDGETYHFSMWVYEHGIVSGEVWSPKRGKTLALTSLAEALADYTRGKADEKKLGQLLKPLER